MVRVPMQLSTAPFAALALILTVIAVISSVSKGLVPFVWPASSHVVQMTDV